MRSNGSPWCGGRVPAIKACSCVIGSSIKRCAANCSVKSEGASSLPAALFMLISQALAALTKISFRADVIARVASCESVGSPLSHYKSACVSSSSFKEASPQTHQRFRVAKHRSRLSSVPAPPSLLAGEDSPHRVYRQLAALLDGHSAQLLYPRRSLLFSEVKIAESWLHARSQALGKPY